MGCDEQGTQIGCQFHQSYARSDSLVHVVAGAERYGRLDQLNRMMEAIASEQRVLCIGDQVQHLMTWRVAGSGFQRSYSACRMT